MIKESFIYNGKVIHKRFKPKKHFFKYNVFSLFLDLSEIKEIDKRISFFSYNKFNLISFYEKDHGQRDGSSLSSWVKYNLKKTGINYSTSNIIKKINLKNLINVNLFGDRLYKEKMK